MLVSLKYKEITDYIKNKYHVEFIFRLMDNKTLQIEYSPASFLPTITMFLHIENIESSSIDFSYNSSKAVQLLIPKVLAFFQKSKTKPFIGTYQKNGQDCISIKFTEIEQLEKSFELLTLSDINFDGEIISMSFDLIQE